jgi:hypothetical protein
MASFDSNLGVFQHLPPEIRRQVYKILLQDAIYEAQHTLKEYPEVGKKYLHLPLHTILIASRSIRQETCPVLIELLGQTETTTEYQMLARDSIGKEACARLTKGLPDHKGVGSTFERPKSNAKKRVEPLFEYHKSCRG